MGVWAMMVMMWIGAKWNAEWTVRNKSVWMRWRLYDGWWMVH